MSHQIYLLLRSITFYLLQILISCLVITASQSCYAQENQPNSFIKIDDITIIGNKKTKEHIILRELDFTIGDSINVSDTSEVFAINKNKIYNTGLFIVCDYKVIEKSPGVISFILIVKENWYIWPIPYIDLGDRNFNEWWQERDKDFNRLIYGIHFRHDNFRGRNEKLKLKLEFGFIKKYEIFYSLPYINKKRTTGVSFGVSYTENKKVAFKTTQHKLDYLNTDKTLRHRFFFQTSLLHRSKYYVNHKITARINVNSINDTIAKLNPNYFGNNNLTQDYFSLAYSFTYDKRDIQYYPLKGHYVYFQINKKGLGIFNDLDMINLIVEGSKYYQISKKIFAGNHLRIKVSTPTTQPYYNTKGLGYSEQIVRGFELYVVDGQHYMHNRNEIKWRLLKTVQETNKLVPVEQFQTIPISIYLSAFIDNGYVVDNSHNPDNTFLNNRAALGYGIGLNIVSFYESVLRFEVSKNDLNETGLFLHLDAPF